MKSKMLTLVVTSLLTLSVITGCRTKEIVVDDGYKDPVVIIVAPQDIPYKLTEGEITPFKGYLVNPSDLIALRHGKSVNIPKLVDKDVQIEVLIVFLLHPDLVDVDPNVGTMRLKVHQ